MPGPEDFGATKAGPAPAGLGAFYEFLGRLLETRDFPRQQLSVIEETRRRLAAWPALPVKGTTVVANWGVGFELSFLVQVGTFGMTLRADTSLRVRGMAKPVYCLLLNDQGWTKEYGSWQKLIDGLASIELYELERFKTLYEDETGSTTRESSEGVLIDYMVDHGHPGAPR